MAYQVADTAFTSVQICDPWIQTLCHVEISKVELRHRFSPFTCYTPISIDSSS